MQQRSRIDDIVSAIEKTITWKICVDFESLEMKVVYLNFLYDIKKLSVGASVHVSELTKALNAQGYDIRPYNLNPYPLEETSTQTTTRKVFKGRLKLHRYLSQINALFANYQYFKKAMRIIKRDRPDVIMLRYNRLNFAVVMIRWLTKIPLLLELNAPLTYEYRMYVQDFVKLPILPEFTEWLSLKTADSVFVVSKSLKDYYVNWKINEKKIYIVENGADLDKFSDDLTSRADQLIEQHKLRDKVVVGFIGSFHYWHGVDRFFKFIDVIANKYSKVQFLLVGSGPMKNELQEIINTENLSDKVIFTNYIPHDEIAVYLAAMDIVLAIYPKVDFFYFSPLKIFEYMAAGKAVLATKIGQITEIIDHGKNGMLFEPDDFDDLQAKVFQLIENRNLRLKIGKQAAETIKEKYTWNHTAEKISKILLELNNNKFVK